MSASVDTQLREYTALFDAELPDIDLEDVLIERVGMAPVRPMLPRRPQNRPWLAAAATAAAVLILVGGLGLLSRVTRDTPPASTVPPASTTLQTGPTTTPPESTIAPPEGSTTTLQPNPTTTLPATLPSFPAEVGELTWSRSDDNVPGYAIEWIGVQGYVATVGTSRYRSDDGISWTMENLDPGIGGENLFHADVGNDAWLIDYPVDDRDPSSGLYRPDGSGYVEAVVPLGLPAIEGNRWSAPYYATVAGVDGLVLVRASSTGTVPWDDILDFDGPVQPSWNDPAQTLELLVEGTADPVAVLTFHIESIDPLHVVFTDNETGEIVHEVRGPNPGVTRQGLASNIGNLFVSSLFNKDVWFTSTDEGVSFVPAQIPWDPGSAVAVQTIGGTLFALTNDHAEEATVQLWATSNGRDWDRLTLPNFGLAATAGFGVDLLAAGDTLSLHLFRDDDSATVWVSPDGKSWVHLAELPIDGNFAQTSFGWVVADPEGGIYVSTDLQSWVSVDGPPGSDGTRQSVSAAGDAVFVYRGFGDDSGTTWVGRFSSP